MGEFAGGGEADPFCVGLGRAKRAVEFGVGIEHPVLFAVAPRVAKLRAGLRGDEEAGEWKREALARELEELGVGALHHFFVQPVETGPALDHDELSFGGGERDGLEIGFDIAGRVGFERAEVFDHHAVDTLPIEDLAKICRAQSVREDEAVGAEFAFRESEHLAQAGDDGAGFGIADLFGEAGRKCLRERIDEDAAEGGGPIRVGDDLRPPLAEFGVGGIGARRAGGVGHDLAARGAERPLGAVGFEGVVAGPVDEGVEVEENFGVRVALRDPPRGVRDAGLGAAVGGDAVAFLECDQRAATCDEIDLGVGEAGVAFSEMKIEWDAVPRETG